MTPPGHCSLVTWNILAPCWARQEKYPWAQPQQLAWGRRQQKIVDRLAELDPDIINLQEVEVALWDGLLHELSGLGYDGVLQETTRGHPVANAVLLRKGTLALERSESRSRALISVIRSVGLPPSAPPLYLANVHLEAGADKGATRFAQLRSLLRRLELQRAMDAAAAQGRPRLLSPKADADGAAFVLAGDFNFDRSADLHAFLSKGTVPGGVMGGSRKRGAKPALLPLRDAYETVPPPWGPPLRSSYRNGRLLDFLFHSPAVEVTRTMPVCDLAGSSQPHHLPSSDHPSDHLPLGALLSWPGAPPDQGAPRPAWQNIYVENVQRQRQPRIG